MLQRTADKADYEQCKWTYIRQNASFHLLNDVVFPVDSRTEEWLGTEATSTDDRLHEVTGRLSDAYFILDTNKSDTLTRAVALIDDLFGTSIRVASILTSWATFSSIYRRDQGIVKNGQFRYHATLFASCRSSQPTLGSKVLDPARGSGGFLLNTLLQWKAQHTDPQVLKREWDGTPHDTYAVFPTDISNSNWANTSTATTMIGRWSELRG